MVCIFLLSLPPFLFHIFSKAQETESNPTKKEQKTRLNVQEKETYPLKTKQKNRRKAQKEENDTAKDKKELKGKKREMAINDDIYNIESLVRRKGSKYLVKWENFPENQNTWESRSSIPCLILQFYENRPSRFGTALPANFEQDFEQELKVENTLEKRKNKNGTYLLKRKIEKSNLQLKVNKS